MKYPEIDQYYADPSMENRNKLMDILGQEHFKISDLGVTSRVFSNWKLKNIIPKVDERQWVRLNLFEYFWIQIIKDLRALGLPLKLIEKVKDQLFFNLTLREVLFDEQGNFRDDVLRKSVGDISDRVSKFLEENKLYEVLGLFILFIVGIMLLTDGFQYYHPTPFYFLKGSSVCHLD